MRTLKNYAMALVALAIAATSVTMMSFGEKNNELVWFESNEDGDILSYISTGLEPGGDCTETTDSTPRCAIAMNESDVDTNGPVPVSHINNIDEDPSLIQQERFSKP